MTSLHMTWPCPASFIRISHGSNQRPSIASTHHSSLGPTADAGFTLSGVPLAEVDKALMPCLHYCIVVQLSFMS